jgi:hypothetical protein
MIMPGFTTELSVVYKTGNSYQCVSTRYQGNDGRDVLGQYYRPTCCLCDIDGFRVPGRFIP